jgi:hypothetical protein
MDMAGLASLLPMPIGTKRIASRKSQAETVSETLTPHLSQNSDQLAAILAHKFFLGFLLITVKTSMRRAPTQPSGTLAEIMTAMLVPQRDQDRLERPHQRQDQGSHTGGACLTSVRRARATKIPPTIRMMNAHRVVAAVLRGQIDAADRTARTNGEETLEQRTLAAGRPEARVEGMSRRAVPALSARPARCGRPTSRPR